MELESSANNDEEIIALEVNIENDEELAPAYEKLTDRMRQFINEVIYNEASNETRLSLMRNAMFQFNADTDPIENRIQELYVQIDIRPFEQISKPINGRNSTRKASVFELSTNQRAARTPKRVESNVTAIANAILEIKSKTRSIGYMIRDECILRVSSLLSMLKIGWYNA